MSGATIERRRGIGRLAVRSASDTICSSPHTVSPIGTARSHVQSMIHQDAIVPDGGERLPRWRKARLTGMPKYVPNIVGMTPSIQSLSSPTVGTMTVFVQQDSVINIEVLRYFA